MFSFIKLINNAIVIGQVTHEDEVSLVIENAVEIGVKPHVHAAEQHYHIKGMFSPFSSSNPILTEIYKEHVLSTHEDLDVFLEKQYMQYITDWFDARDNRNNLKSNLEEVKQEDVDMLEALLQRQANANNEIH